MLCACVHACGGVGARTKKSFVAVIAVPPVYPAIRPIATPPLGPICRQAGAVAAVAAVAVAAGAGADELLLTLRVEDCLEGARDGGRRDEGRREHAGGGNGRLE